MFESRIIEANGLRFHVMTVGPETAPPLLMLHGFPEYWVGWKAVAERLAEDFRVILPDQRGYNLSSKPAGVENYETVLLAADMASLMDVLAPGQRFDLCGHDWGASVAYYMAMRMSEQVARLVIANGVHPICFQKAIFEDEGQRAASQYMNTLRAPDARHRVSRDNFGPLLRMLEGFSSAEWMDDETRDAYRTAWSNDDALETMLHWYRASPIKVPETSETGHTLPITDAMRERFRVTMPHLLLWGDADAALRPVCHADLPGFCDDLSIVPVPGAGHWLLHEQPDVCAGAIRSFLRR